MSRAPGQPPEADATLISGDSMIGDVAGLGQLGPGKRFGRYIVLARIGAGELGIVYAAHDPEHDRTVAIKLLRPRISEERAREAKRAAEIVHPNLVAIHEVGCVHEIVFVVMDHVSGGKRLREWIDEGPGPWPVALEVLRKLGAGLATAHRAALVHGNLTPDNVLLDRGLEPKLSDLGLTAAATNERGSAKPRATRRAEDSSSADALAAPLTPADQRHGNWAYLAPERWAGGAADARADQFAYCVALYEALYGERPFEGRSIQAVLQAIHEGRLRAPPSRTKVPGWLRRVVTRGLAGDPAQRWPSMDDLLEAIDQGQGTRRRWAVSGTAAVVAVLASVVAIARSNPEDSIRELAEQSGEVCGVEPAPEQCRRFNFDTLDGAWTPAHRDAIAARYAAIARPWAAPSSEFLLTELDAFAEMLASEGMKACEPARTPASSLEGRWACFERQRRRFAAFVDALTEIDELGAAELESSPLFDELDSCRAVPNPAPLEPELRAREQSVEAALDHAQGLQLAGRHADADALLAELSLALAKVDRPALQIEYRLLRGRSLVALGILGDGEGWLLDALHRAIVADEARLGFLAACELASMHTDADGLALARPWLEVAAALLERLGDEPKLAAKLLLTQARLARLGGYAGQAREAAERAYAALGPFADAHDDLALELALDDFELGDLASASHHLEQVRTNWLRRGGPDHPRSLELLGLAMRFALADGRLDDARAHYQDLLQRSELPDPDLTAELDRLQAKLAL